MIATHFFPSSQRAWKYKTKARKERKEATRQCWVMKLKDNEGHFSRLVLRASDNLRRFGRLILRKRIVWSLKGENVEVQGSVPNLWTPQEITRDRKSLKAVFFP